MTNATPILQVKGLEHRYNGVLAIDGIDLDVDAGGFLAVLGPNGAGKSTLAQIVAGMLPPTRGEIFFEGTRVERAADGTGLVDLGVVLIPEGRRLFGQMSAEENLLLGAYGTPRSEKLVRLEKIYSLLPSAIKAAKNRPAASFSGGEQQMLALGRALMRNPRALIVDEPSLGLAPILTHKVYELLAQMSAQGISIVVLEQLATNAIGHAKQFVVLNRGRIINRGSTKDQDVLEAIQIGYLGHE